MFKNFTIYRFNASAFNLKSTEMNDQLVTLALNELSATEPRGAGFVPPLGEEGQMVKAIGNDWLIALGIEKKILPASVVKEVTALRAAEIEETHGYKPGRKQIREIKELVTTELLAKAFSVKKKVFAWLDVKNGYLAIASSSAAIRDEFVYLLLRAVGQEKMPLGFVDTERSPSSVMTEWVATFEHPAVFSIDQNCLLEDHGNQQVGKLRYIKHALANDEMRSHVEKGKVVSELAMTWNDRASFVLTSKMDIKKFTLLDITNEKQSELADTEQYSVEEVDFILHASEIRNMLPDLFAALGGLKTA